jgi:ketol-acid reductoisomerase
MWCDDDADLSLIQDRHVAVLGYGSEGQAHALSLRDTGVDVRVGLPEGSPERSTAEAEGLRVVPAYEACEEANLVVLLETATARTTYAEAVEPNLVDGDAVLVSSGFDIRYGYIRPPDTVDIGLVSFAAPGDRARREYSEGRGVPVLLAVEQDATGEAWPLTLSYAKAIGGLRGGGIETTVAELTEAELFGQQAVAGGVARLVVAGFETLTDAGYAPEVAYLACLRDLAAVLDRVVAPGAQLAGPRLIGADVQKRMREVLDEIRDGSLTRRLTSDEDSSGGELAALTAEGGRHPIESTGRELRSRMAWLRHGNGEP